MNNSASSPELPLDPITLLSFLHGLSAAQEGYLTLTAMHPTDATLRSPSRHIDLSHPNSGQLEHDLADLLAANAQGWGAFFGIATRRSNLGSYRRGGKHDLLAVPVIPIDIDRPPNRARRALQLLPEPTLIVESGYGLHAYLALSEHITDIDYADRLISHLNHLVHGDASLNASTSMRLPQTVNHKPGRNRLALVTNFDPQRRYYAFDLPQPPPLPQLPAANPGTVSQSLIDALLEILTRSYGAVPRYSHSTWYKAYCPWQHARDSVGSHFFFDSRTGAGNCFGKHGPISPRALCERFHLNPADYRLR